MYKVDIIKRTCEDIGNPTALMYDDFGNAIMGSLNGETPHHLTRLEWEIVCAPTRSQLYETIFLPETLPAYPLKYANMHKYYHEVRFTEMSDIEKQHVDYEEAIAAAIIAKNWTHPEYPMRVKVILEKDVITALQPLISILMVSGNPYEKPNGHAFCYIHKITPEDLATIQPLINAGKVFIETLIDANATVISQ